MNARMMAMLLPCSVLFACSRAESPPPVAAPLDSPPAVAEALLAGASGSQVTGTLQLTAAEGGVSITGQIRGFEGAGEHGFHVHERGDCSAPDASSAGEHLNPHDMAHGNPISPERHLGDMPNIQVDASRQADISVTIAGATLHTGAADDLVGRSILVHAQRDDYITQPAGDSGDRIACGVVR